MLRNTLIISLIFIFILLTPIIAAAKHIIVFYDVSGSMVSLRIDGQTNVYMGSNDMRRVNEYLTNLLFTNTSQDLRDNANDTYIKECDAVLVGKPLYQSGDILTYVEYAKKGNTKINREQISKNDFQQQLPNPMTLRRSFYGKVSYLLRAEVEVYDELYRETDDETYWVFVTDGDIDNSGKSDPGIANVLKRQAIIEDEFYDPMIFGVFVNNHVKIEVRRLQKRGDIDSIFIATPTKPKEPVRKIQLSRDKEGKFFSETLLINTENSEESKFKLNNFNVEIVDRNYRPLQIINEDNTSDILNVDPVELNGNPPPYEFRLLLPANREIAASDNKMKLEVAYSFNGEDKVFSVPLMNYTAVIKSIYVASITDPDSPTKLLELQFADDKYNVSLTVQTESPQADAFQIDQIRCQVQYKDTRKLCDVTVPKVIERLGEPFAIEVPKHGRLDWYGNKVVLEIDYRYENETLNTTIEAPYELKGGGTGFPLWVLWVLLVPVLGVILFLVIRAIIKRVKSKPVEHRIKLAIEDSMDEFISNDDRLFTLTDKNSLAFGENDAHEMYFDVEWPDCPDFLRCEKKLPWPWSKNKGRIRHHKSIDDAEGEIVNVPGSLTLKRDEDNIEVYIQYDKEDNISDTKSNDESFEGSTDRVDPLKV
ncbi:MAG: hypothetical protein OXI67_13095 [Candidatus Poribacteria bacterium]|nr:hypothetical protein [Candidatus Poribacteria bacterium]